MTRASGSRRSSASLSSARTCFSSANCSISCSSVGCSTVALEIVLEFEEFLREAHRVDVIPALGNRAADVVDPCRIHGRQIGYFARERLENLGALAQFDPILLRRTFAGIGRIRMATAVTGITVRKLALANSRRR